MLHLPGRKVVTRSPHRRVGLLSCPWFQRIPIAWESLLELNFLKIALLCPKLLSIEAQPFRIEIGRGVTYTPDFLLRFAGGVEMVIEVKPVTFVSQSQEKLDQAQRVLREYGYEFMLVTDQQIYDADRHQRAALYYRYAQSNAVLGIDQVLACFSSKQGPISKMVLLREAKVALLTLMHLVGRRLLVVDSTLHDDSLYLEKSFFWGNHGYLSPRAWLGCADW